jgi:hypothetical protein
MALCHAAGPEACRSWASAGVISSSTWRRAARCTSIFRRSPGPYSMNRWRPAGCSRTGSLSSPPRPWRKPLEGSVFVPTHTTPGGRQAGTRTQDRRTERRRDHRSSREHRRFVRSGCAVASGDELSSLPGADCALQGIYEGGRGNLARHSVEVKRVSLLLFPESSKF